jgi:hypothetical protein
MQEQTEIHERLEFSQISDDSDDSSDEAGRGGFIQDSIRERCGAWGKQIESTGESLATIGKQLRMLGAAPAAELADRFAGYARDFASYLQTAELDTMLHDAETLARQQPYIVIGAGFILGLAGARMLKVGSGRRYEMYGDEPSWRS